MSLSRRLAAFLMSPLGALLLFGVTVPVSMLFAFSFFHLHLLEVVPGATLDNYRQAVTTEIYRSYAINTFLIAAPTAAVSVAAGYALAYFLAFRARRSRGIVLVAVVTALMGSYLALIYSWRTLSGESGIFNSLLEALHVTHGPLSVLLFSRVAVITAEVNFFLPFTTLVLYSSLTAIPQGAPGGRATSARREGWRFAGSRFRSRAPRSSVRRYSSSSCRPATTSPRCSSGASGRAARSER